MSRSIHLNTWTRELANRFPDLPVSVVAVLAMYSFGMVLAKVSGLSRITFCLTQRIVLSIYDAIRKRLSEFDKEAPAKSGAKCGIRRCEFEVAGCFACLLRCVD